MRFYFISKEECAVKIDGEYVGITAGNLLYTEHCGRNLLIEFFPSDKNYAPSSVFFKKSEKGFFGNVTAVPSKDGFLFFPLFSPAKDRKIRNIYQKTFEKNHVGVSLLSDPYYKITVANAEDYYFTQPKYYADKSLIDCRLIGDFLFLTINSKHTYLYVFSVKNKIEQRYAEEIDSVIFSDKIEVTKKPVGATGCKVIEYYSLTDFSLIEKKIERTRSAYGLMRELIPCAFLEELSHGGDFTEYLSLTLKRDNRLIAEFFGNFIFFIPYCLGDELYAAIVYADRVETVVFSLSSDNSVSDFSFI